MMKLKNLRLGMALAVLGIAGAGSVWAQGPGGQPGPGDQDGMPGMGPHRPPMERAMGPRGEHGRWWNDPKAVEKFKFTDSQRKSMDDIYQQNRVNLVDLHASLEKLEIAMEPLMKADQPDEGRILAQIDRIAQARAELEKANARMLLGIRRQLTPEQWKQMDADRTARREGRGPAGEGARRWHGRPGQDGTGSDQAPPPPGNPGGENE